MLQQEVTLTEETRPGPENSFTQSIILLEPTSVDSLVDRSTKLMRTPKKLYKQVIAMLHTGLETNC